MLWCKQRQAQLRNKKLLEIPDETMRSYSLSPVFEPEMLPLVPTLMAKPLESMKGEVFVVLACH